jgi:hypothetical protein
VQAMQRFEYYAKGCREIGKFLFVRLVKRLAIVAIEELGHGEHLTGMIA